MTAPGANNGERLPVIDSQPAFENALRRALEMDEPLQGVLCCGLTLDGAALAGLEALQVSLERCRFEGCSFSKASFYDVRLIDCDFVSCAFPDSYWKRCRWSGCRMNGADFAGASLHDVQARDTRLRYANFAHALMEDVNLRAEHRHDRLQKDQVNRRQRKAAGNQRHDGCAHALVRVLLVLGAQAEADEGAAAVAQHGGDGQRDHRQREHDRIGRVADGV